jgi:plastocyanin
VKTMLQKTLRRLSLLDLVLAGTPVVLLLAAACIGGAHPAVTMKSPSGIQPAPLAAIATMTTATTAQSADAADGTQVTISNFTFNPKTLTVAAGTTVTWTNNDSLTHTVTADDGSFDSANLRPGQQFSYTFTTPGTYTYHCSIHPFMTASVVVLEKPSNPS